MSDNGFAMADTIVAMTVASMFITSLLGINANSLRAGNAGTNKLTATLIAKSVLEDRSLREDTGRFSVSGQAYEWNRHITSRAGSPNDILQLNDIVITVTWQGRNAPQSLVVTTAKYRAKR